MNRKKVLLITIPPLLLLIALLIPASIYRNSQAEYIQKHLTTYIESSTTHAVTWDSIQVTLTGAIEIHNLEVAQEEDFNHERRLLVAPKIILKGKNLFSDTITITDIRLNKPRFAVYISGPLHTWETELSDLWATIEKSIRSGSEDLTVSFTNGTAAVSGMHENKNLRYELAEIEGTLGKTGKTLTVSVSATPSHQRDYSDPVFSFGYTLTRSAEGRSNMEGTFSIHEYHPEQINSILKELEIPYELSGTINGTVYHNHTETEAYQWHIEGDALSLLKLAPTQYPIIYKEQITTEGSLTAKRDEENNESLELKDFSFQLGNVRLDASGKGVWAESELQECICTCDAGTIDFTSLSRSVTPLHGLTYKGEGSARARIEWNREQGFTQESNARIDGRNITMQRQHDGIHHILLKDSTIALELHGNTFSVKGNLSNGFSDLTVSAISTIESWAPLKTRSTLTLSSRKMELRYPSLLAYYGTTALYKGAIKNLKKGYEDGFFLQTTAGTLVNNQDLSVNVTTDRLYLDRNRYLTGLDATLSLTRGVLQATELSLDLPEGSSGSFFFRAYLNRDYPFIKTEGSVSNLDLTTIPRDTPYEAEGILSLNMEWEGAVHRLSHILTNGKGRIDVRLQNYTMARNDFITALSSFFSAHGHTMASQIPEFSTLQGSIAQSGTNFYLNSIQIQNDAVTVQGRSAFSPFEGLEIPFYPRIRVGEYSWKTVPVILGGTIANPVISMKEPAPESSSAPESLSLYDIHEFIDLYR